MSAVGVRSAWGPAALRAGVLSAALLALPGVGAPAAAVVAEPSGDRVDLRVLVVSSGGPEAALADQLTVQGVPFTTVDLYSDSRPVIDEDFLSDTVSTGPRARFQAVVLPDPAPSEMSPAELTALADFERRFGIRQVNAYTWAHPGVGLNYATDPGFIGTFDGMTATVTPEGLAGSFGYLRGQVPFDDNTPAVPEASGALAVPLPDDPAVGTSFTTLVGMTIPGTSVQGSLLGVYRHDGREELVSTFWPGTWQSQFRVLAPGIVDWMTRGVHLGEQRNYHSVHVDDVLMADDRWSVTADCVPGDAGCDADPTAPIRMTAADVDHLLAWQAEHGFVLDLVFNGAGSQTYVAEHGSDPLLSALTVAADRVRWINHTYEHLFLGCLQDLTVSPWTCLVTSRGVTRWTTSTTIANQITRNLTWASGHRLPLDPAELVTGEHSGLFISPQQRVDNPNLAPALNRAGIRWIAADASRDRDQRLVGPARTVPRHPMNLFYNVGTREEEIDEYNWIYSAAPEGSGLCEQNPATMTCIEPLTVEQFDSHLVPLEATIALRHALSNDPRPTYVHQSNLSEDRLLYPVLERILDQYHALFADDTPLLSPTMSEAGEVLARQDSWSDTQDSVVAYTLNGGLHVESTAGTHDVPVTVPQGTVTATDGAAYGAAYGGRRSDWTAVTTSTPLSLRLPA